MQAVTDSELLALLEADEEPTVGGYAPVTDDALVAELEGTHDPYGEYDPLADTDVVDRTLIGIGRGMTNVGRGVQDLWFRATGDDDALGRLNQRIESEETAWNHAKENSTAAMLGEVGGEIAATLPLGMGVAGVAAKGGMGLTKAAVLEGAITEGITQRGDAGDRLVAAGMGGVMSGVGQKVFDGGGKLLKGLRKADDADGITDELLEPLTEAQKRIKEAKEFGGYDLDMADASLDDMALREKHDILRSEDGQSMRNFVADQNERILEKADSLVENTGGHYLDDGAVGDSIQTIVAGLRQNDESAYKSLYEKLDASRGGQPLDVSGLQQQLPRILNDHKISADATTSNIKKVLEKYGVLENRTTSVIGVDGLSRDVRGTTGSVRKTAKQLTMGNYESMIQELNDLYKPMASKGENRAIGETKKVLEKWMDESLETQGLDPSLVSLGREARKARRAFADKWEKGDALERMTTLKDDEYRLRPTEAFAHFSRRRNVGDLKKLKSKLLLESGAEGKQAWADMQQVPLLKALQAATKHNDDVVGGAAQFSHKKFQHEWDKIPEQTKQVLYTPKQLQEINGAIKAWSLRNKRSRTAFDDNPSGTTRATVGVFARILAPPGRTAGAALAALPVIDSIKQSAHKSATRKASEALASGTITGNHRKALDAQITEALEAHYQKTDLGKFGEVGQLWLQELSRSIARETTDEDTL